MALLFGFLGLFGNPFLIFIALFVWLAASQEASLAQMGSALDMQRDFVTADPREMLQTALARLRSCGCHTLPVVQGDRLVGLVTADNLAEVLLIQGALRQA